MNISVQKQPKCQATLEVEIPNEVISAERKQLVQSFSEQARIPGFRPGKAPLKVIEKRFAKAIAEELNGRLMDQAFQETLKQDNSLKVIDVKWPDSLDHAADGSATLRANMILAPEFTLPDYKGVEIEVPKQEVTPESIDREIATLKERNSDFSEIEDRAAEKDDIIVIDYTSTCDGKKVEEVAGKPVAQIEEGKDFWIKVEEESFLPGFAPQMIGMKINDSREVTVTIDEAFPLEPLRGKDIIFQVTLKAIKEQKLPTDDELVTALMPGGSIDDIREALESQMRFQISREVQQFKEGALLDKIANSVDFDLPDEYITAETQGQADRLVEDAMRQGLDETQLQEQQEQIFETAGQRARNNLKVQFLLSEIATAEKISVPEPELIKHLTEMAQREGKPLKKLIKELQQARRLDSIRNQLLIGKTIDFLLENANLTEVEPTTEASDE